MLMILSNIRKANIAHQYCPVFTFHKIVDCINSNMFLTPPALIAMLTPITATTGVKKFTWNF